MFDYRGFAVSPYDAYLVSEVCMGGGGIMGNPHGTWQNKQTVVQMVCRTEQKVTGTTCFKVKLIALLFSSNSWVIMDVPNFSCIGLIPLTKTYQ